MSDDNEPWLEISDERKTNAMRLLVVIYDLADGRVGFPIDNDVLLAKAEELDIFNMSVENFHLYRTAVVARVKALS